MFKSSKHKKQINNFIQDFTKYKISDFSAESQDKICIALMKAQRPNLISKIIKGEIEDAIKALPIETINIFQPSFLKGNMDFT